MTLNKSSTIGALYLLPFFIFFTATSTALFQPDSTGQAQQSSSLLNQIALTLAYSTAFILLLKQPGVISSTLSKALPLNILFFLMLISVFWSNMPVKVVISVIHNTGVTFITLCMALLLVKDKEKFFKYLLMALFIYITATIIVSLFIPSIGLMTSANKYDTSLIGRWRGLTDHPNSLGSICLFTSWVTLSSYFYSKQSKFIKLIALITLTANLYCLYKANSMTSLLLSIALIIGIGWFTYLGKASGGIKALKIMFAVFSFFMICAFILMMHPEYFSEKYFFYTIGRDSSLSGRSRLWQIGLRGFSEKPMLGWGYDSLVSFLTKYHMGYGTLHNGYLDLLVRGGIVSVFFFSVLLIQLFGLLIKQTTQNKDNYVFILALIITVLVHNMSESSLLTNTNLIWLMFLLGYFYSIKYKSINNNIQI